MCPLPSSASTTSTMSRRASSAAAHAHKKLRQVLWCPYGKILIKLDDGFEKAEVLLDSPDKGLIVESNMWRDMLWQQDNSVLCVAADSFYDADDYIRNYEKFLRYVGAVK